MVEGETYKKDDRKPDQGGDAQSGAGTERAAGQAEGEGKAPSGYYGVGYQRRLNDPAYLDEGEFHEHGSGENYHSIGSKDHEQNDKRIYEEIRDHLIHNGDLEAGDITVKVVKGQVTLEGKVPTRAMKHLADEIAESVQGVLDVHNRLRIEDQAS